jgi:hypothetical protein
VELQPSALPEKQDFLRENVCPACLRDGTCSPGSLQLDNIQTQGPQLSMVLRNMSEYAPTFPSKYSKSGD